MKELTQDPLSGSLVFVRLVLYTSLIRSNLMAKKAKIKCPKCESSKDVQETVEDEYICIYCDYFFSKSEAKCRGG